MNKKHILFRLSLTPFLFCSCLPTNDLSDEKMPTNELVDDKEETNTNHNDENPSSEETGGNTNTGEKDPGQSDEEETGGNTGGGGSDSGHGSEEETGGNEDEYDLNNPVSLNVHSLTLYVNGTYQLNPQNKNNLPLFYTSDISDYVQVSSTGLITAKEICKTKVTVRDSIGNSDYCIVEVKQNPNFKFNVNYLDLFVNETATISTSVSGTTYSSENEKIATISSSGEIKAISAGIVNLVARKDNSIDKCQLRVVLQNHSMFEFELNNSGTYTVNGFSSIASNEDKKNVIIPYKYNDKLVTHIKDSAFFYKINLGKEIILPNSIKSIGGSAFFNASFSSSETLYLPNQIEFIGQFGFCGGTYNYIYFPRKNFTLTDKTFQNCHSLKKVYIPYMLTLPKNPFHDANNNFTHIYLEEGITTIPEEFCHALHELEYINIPSSVTKIEPYMLYAMKYNDFGIRELVIPRSVEVIASRIYVFFPGTGEVLPEIPLKILYERETKPDTYSDSNDDSAYYYSITQPKDEGRYWHYVNNEPTIW